MTRLLSNRNELKVKWVISEHTTTDSKRLLYLAEENGGTGDVEVVEYKADNIDEEEEKMRNLKIYAFSGEYQIFEAPRIRIKMYCSVCKKWVIPDRLSLGKAHIYGVHCGNSTPLWASSAGQSGANQDTEKRQRNMEKKESKKFVCPSCGHVYVDEPLDKSELRKRIEKFVQENPFLQNLDVDKNKIVDFYLEIAEKAYSLNRELIEWEKKTFGVILCPICKSPLSQLSERRHKE